MTTRVEVKLPKPNHNRIKVTNFDRNEDGAWIEGYSYILNHGDNKTDLYVYDSRRIIIEEID